MQDCRDQNLSVIKSVEAPTLKKTRQSRKKKTFQSCMLVLGGQIRLAISSHFRNIKRKWFFHNRKETKLVQNISW